MSDLSNMSDEALLAIARGGVGVSDKSNLSNMSDDDLWKLAGIKPLAHRESEPSREQMIEAYKEQKRGEDTRMGDTGSTARTAFRGLTRAVPFIDDIAAAGQVFRGKAGSHQEALDRERARNAVDDEERPVASYGGQIAGGLALPGGAARTGATALQAGARAAAASGAYGAAYGAGAGDGVEDRLSKAGVGGALGGAIGGPVGAIAHRLMRPAAKAAAPARNAVEEAADNIGVDLPMHAGSDNMVVQRAAQGLRNVPIAGDPLVKANTRMLEQLGGKVDDAAAGLGGQSAEGAGEAAGKRVRDWISKDSSAKLKTLYDDVDKHVDNTVLTPLAETRNQVADILARRKASYQDGSGGAVERVAEAIKAKGLTYKGLKDLRTSIRQQIKGGPLPANIDGAELKQIHSALTKDFTAAVKNADRGGGVKAFNRANMTAKGVAARRERLADLVGVHKNASAAQVFDRLTAAASSKSRQDTKLLILAKKTLAKDEWDGVASAVLGKMGKDVEGNFSPDRFLTDFGKLSDTGKNLMFGGSGGNLAKSLEDIATISSRLKSNAKQFGNPSGTAQNVAWGTMGVGALAHLPATVAAMVGVNAAARIMSNPKTARSMAATMRSAENAMKSGTAGSLKMLQTSVRQFASAANDNLGLGIDPAALMRSVGQGAADDEKPE